jgi:hypothetical protein
MPARIAIPKSGFNILTMYIKEGNLQNSPPININIPVNDKNVFVPFLYLNL